MTGQIITDLTEVQGSREDETSTNVLIELDTLHLHRPALGAAPAVVAAWYREKAIVLDHLGHTEDAIVARAHADRLAVAA